MLKNVLSIVIALVLIALGWVQLNESDPKSSNDPNQTNKKVEAGQPKAGQPEKPGKNLAGNTLKNTPKSGSQPAKSQPDTGSKKATPPANPGKTPTPKRGPPANSKPVAKTPAKKTPSKKAPAKKPASQRVVVTMRGGKKEDITDTLARIKRGEKHSHRNDGSVFGNYERRLPRKQRGYYREYVHPTPGIRHAGARRVVMGKRGEIYYTHDHYKTFTKVTLPR